LWFPVAGDGTVEELVDFEVDLKEGWARGRFFRRSGPSLKGSLDVSFARHGAQRTRAVAAVNESFIENPLFGFLVDWKS